MLVKFLDLLRYWYYNIEKTNILIRKNQGKTPLKNALIAKISIIIISKV